MNIHLKKAIFLFLIFISFSSCGKRESVNLMTEKAVKPDNPVQSEYLIIEKVIDGDTFRMSDGEKVRLIGIDTPEKYDSDKLDRQSVESKRDKETIKRLGEAASEYVRALAEGKKVRLEKDKSNQDRDRYGRLLRYVYFEDGTLLNAKIISDGYANVYNSSSVSKLEEFKKLEKDARENKRGLWGNVDGLR